MYGLNTVVHSHFNNYPNESVKKGVANFSLDDFPMGSAKNLGVANFFKDNIPRGSANKLGVAN